MYFRVLGSVALYFLKLRFLQKEHVGYESILLDLTLECRNKIPRICVFLIEIFVVDPLAGITDLLKILRD